MFEFREQCSRLVRNYVPMQGDRILPVGIYCLLMAAGPHIMWIPFEVWGPWSHLAVFGCCFGLFWIAGEQCETRYGDLSPDDRASRPPTVRGRLVLGAILTAVLVVGILLNLSVGAVELVVAAWIFGYRLQGGRLRQLYIVVGAALSCVGIYDTLIALSGEPVIGGSWFMAIAGTVVVFRAGSDQSTFLESLKLMRTEGGYDV